jgi:hypothetical protein
MSFDEFNDDDLWTRISENVISPLIPVTSLQSTHKVLQIFIKSYYKISYRAHKHEHLYFCLQVPGQERRANLPRQLNPHNALSQSHAHDQAQKAEVPRSGSQHAQHVFTVARTATSDNAAPRNLIMQGLAHSVDRCALKQDPLPHEQSLACASILSSSGEEVISKPEAPPLYSENRNVLATNLGPVFNPSIPVQCNQKLIHKVLTLRPQDCKQESSLIHGSRDMRLPKCPHDR